MMRMPRLGRGVYVTLGLAILVLTITYGSMDLWPRIQEYRTMRALDRRWHDTSLSIGERAKAVEMLAEFGPDAAPYLLAAAHDADGRVRERAYAYLAGLDPMPDEAVRICLAAVKGESQPRARAAAVESLGAVAFVSRKGRPDRRRRIIDSLVVAGRDGSPIVRNAAMRAMINADAKDVDPSPWLEDPDRGVRLAAAEAILWIAPTSKARMVPMLQAMILQADPARAVAVNQPLGLLLRVDRSACRGLVPTFVSWLGREDPDIRGQVVGWLLQLGPVARDAIPALEPLLDRGRLADRAGAAMALVVIDPTTCERASACLLALLGDTAIHPRERIQALHPLNVVLNRPGVPTTVRDAVLKKLRAIPDRPGVHPEFGLRIRQFLDFQQTARARAAGGGVRRVSFQ